MAQENSHTPSLSKIRFLFLAFDLSSCLGGFTWLKIFIILYLVYIMFTNLYSMILNHIALQNYFENISKFKYFPIKILFQACRSTGLVDRSISGLIGRPDRSTESYGLGVHVCARLSVNRTGRPTGTTLLSGFCQSTGSVDRQNKENLSFVCRSTESNG